MSAKPKRFRPQPLFQDGSDLPLFTAYNPQPDGTGASRDAARKAGEQTSSTEEFPSLPVYRTTRVVEFYPNPPDQWLNLSGEAVPVVSETFVSILRSAPRGDGWYLVEHAGRYAWTCWVAAV